MAATSGQDKYIKYFRGDNIDTILKSPKDVSHIQAFAVEDDKKLISNVKLKKGEPILYIDEGVYKTRPLIKVKSTEKYYRVKFTDIEKPKKTGSGSAGSLKPKYFSNVINVKLNRGNYITNLINDIDERKDLPPELKSYLKLLTDNVSGVNNETTLKNLYKKHSTIISTYIKNINKDFAELLGPLYLMDKNPLSKVNVVIKKTDKIFLPETGNYPLVDFMCGPSNNMYQFSSKIMDKVTNVVKPVDIIALIKSNETTYKKWQNTDQFKILKILNDNTMASGSLMVGMYLKKKYKKDYPEYEHLPDDINPTDIRSTTYTKSKFKNFIDKNPNLNKNSTSKNIIYVLDRILENITSNKYSERKRIKFSEIFIDAIKNKVIYIMYKTNNDGTPNFNVKIHKDFENSDVYLRTKNTNNSLSDKMGVQP